MLEGLSQNAVLVSMLMMPKMPYDAETVLGNMP